MIFLMLLLALAAIVLAGIIRENATHQRDRWL